ncbi:MAG: hypothetical protein IKR49_01660 [Clostridia bacterium]|nr:hypothetical protein [Clostridia bacterium]
MKRLISVLFVIIFTLSWSTCCVNAFDQDQVYTKLYEDGSYDVITTTSHFTITKFLNAKGTKSETKTNEHHNADGSLAWKASITASFTYNGTTASCTSVSKSTTIYNSAWKCTASSCSKSGATATGSFTFKYYLLGVPVKTINKTLTLTCDPNGNIT